MFSSVDQVQEELLHTRIVRLTEPEDCLLPQLRILLVLGDIEQLVYRGSVALPLRQGEDDRLAHLAVTHAIVELRYFRYRDARLPGPGGSLLAQLDVFLGIDRDVHQPLLVTCSLLLRQ